MKLISVQSKGDRLVRVVEKYQYKCGNVFFVIAKSLQYGNFEGWCNKTYPPQPHRLESDALKAADEWLEGAKE